jgi:putative oxidoreductase
MNDIRESLELRDSNRFVWLNENSIARWVSIPLRLIVGLGFMQHGFAKFSKGPEAFAAILPAVPNSDRRGYECDLLHLACLAALVLGGSEPMAIDSCFRRNKMSVQ